MKNKVQSEQKEETNEDQSKLNDIETKRKLQRIDKSRSWFFEEINKSIQTHSEKKRDEPNKMRNEKGNIRTDTKENLSKMDKFLETYNPPKLSQEEAESLNRPISASEIEAVIKKLPAHNSP